ncbi:Protein of unknown function - conserved [Leishmania donovani]|uniref:Uncharacterized protein n=3 Tax=Leishmania donovani species complex TaxID=38574 RepID=A4I616_LEIIN|nr:conserved hypothetical protein [Leishmania infantum JPCM5]CAC9515925.1 hypothetical_protein_-_conserved [Leishmania infantum]CAJ1991130.1 Protein of unknown function - conserved [Leishmania donovani]CAM70238.1 conserved hypothetical protein [Leishmania infantum JPCM5]SUZ44156.1 hypothetical_protein_-_conserved [Leishmania infantum]VDZ46977.1 hypothetical_protein_conserved [Leishmania donovani]|eukprot:XP_001467185.1 conserved hypothetical protein [Leishmania infantum JPCM5]
METLKGFARRTTQSLREMVSRTEVSPEEMRLTEVMAKVRIMETKGEMICEKVIQAARLMGELGTTLREIGEEYKGVPDLPKESRELADDVFEVGVKLVETSQEHQKGLKDNGFELLRSFAKQCAQLREVEDARRHHQLEYDFFKSKVQYLRSSPQRDFTRLPRNEQILENWRVELWRATERSKALCSELFVSGRQAIDRSVLTTIQVLHSFVEIASTGFSQTFQGVRLPTYPKTPVLPPTALPPAPAPAPPTPYAYSSQTAVAAPTGAIIPASPGTQAPMPGTAYASTSLPSPANPPGPVAAPQPAPLAPAIGTPYGGAPSYAVTPGAAGSGPAGYQPPPLDIPTSTDNGTTTYQPPPLQ